ncbi:alpha/beta hydrolase [Amycolatopsis rhabdoformis]|uniref:Alpha/beta hydrolase n=1 Tax=Amycolatopsis rhabdoformis TaxID=1448059 RepID=A0ABZ1ICP4_9PSEU|nr:alpha/beta hydrolase [Amycolatopsis rhabdoformis]WSE32195.1 alpha/beta hydrolase [Amycolatopsis rhabdoformis]
MTIPTLVLVPGAWHQPATFDRLRNELGALSYATRGVKLPTTGPRPCGDLFADAAAIRDAVHAVTGPVVVVAHSYGGLPATQALHDVEHVVYLAAYVPDLGDSLYTLHGAPNPESAEGLFPTSADPRDQLYHDLPEAEADRAVRALVDQLHRPFADRVTHAAWQHVPSSYVITEQDRSLPAELQARMATRTNAVHRIASGHSPTCHARWNSPRCCTGSSDPERRRTSTAALGASSPNHESTRP